MGLVESFQHVRATIRRTCQRVGRDPSEVELLAVSKKQPVEKIRQAVELGQVSFGENYVQDLLARQKCFSQPLHWHFIGRLQRKKAKSIAGEVALIHSVDRLELLETLDRAAHSKGVRQDILLQINIGREESKSGICPTDFEEFSRRALDFEALRVRGVMSLPPLSSERETQRSFFRQTRRYFQSLQNLSGHWREGGRQDVNVLSMGTSGDYEIAIEEGATLVRVGTSLFGARP